VQPGTLALEKPRPERAKVLALARAHEIDTAPHAVACARLGSRANSRTSGQADDRSARPIDLASSPRESLRALFLAIFRSNRLRPIAAKS
jgi:hypothetical protein